MRASGAPQSYRARCPGCHTGATESEGVAYHPGNELRRSERMLRRMSDAAVHWSLAFAAAGVVVLAARSRRALSIDGMAAALTLGTVLVGTAGWWAGLLLVSFFVSSSVLSSASCRETAPEQDRGPERDAVQVLANGGIALAAAVFYAVTGAATWIAVLSGSIAAANADTWSTEIGHSSRTLPRLITTGRRVPAGTSGAVSGRGLGGALAGGALIAVLAAVGWNWSLLPGDLDWVLGGFAVTLGGFTGSLVDSLLGATVQERRWCPACAKETEQRVHRCGTRTVHHTGLAWMTNDTVNALCAASGAFVVLIVARLLQ